MGIGKGSLGLDNIIVFLIASYLGRLGEENEENFVNQGQVRRTREASLGSGNITVLLIASYLDHISARSKVE